MLHSLTGFTNLALENTGRPERVDTRMSLNVLLQWDKLPFPITVNHADAELLIGSNRSTPVLHGY